ncbi:hypothetical protein MBN61_00930 [Candidatus Saccharibacteria bacterium]|nr:hypothetical protein [Candidatus Saccharibacteria bacterium]
MKREGGYTVLETGLAIAMSTTLVLLTFGLAAMVGRGRFRDSLVTTQSFIKQQYNEVRSGINSRLTEGDVSTNKMGPVSECKNTAIPGNNNRCYVIGRLLVFNNDGDDGRVQVSFIVAVVSPNSKWPDSTKSGLDNLEKGVKNGVITLYALTDASGNDAGLNPTIKQMGGNMLMKAWLVKSDSSSLKLLYDSAHPGNASGNNMAILRSPVDGSLVVVSKVGLSDVLNSNIAGLKELSFQGAVTNMSQDDKLALAVRNQGLGYPGGVICIPGGDNPAGTSNNFNVAGGNWNWNGGLNKVGPKDVVDACKNMDQ